MKSKGVVSETKRGRAFWIALKIYSIIYVITAVLIILVDAGNSEWGSALASVGKRLVPTIAPTANLARESDSVALVLTISWLWGVVGLVVGFMMLIPKDAINTCYVANMSWVYRYAGIVLLPSAICVGYSEFFGTDGFSIGRRVFQAIERNSLFSIPWGMGIWFSFVLLAICLRIALVRKSDCVEE